MDTFVNVDVEELSEPLTISVEPYVSREYAQAEGDRLWSKVAGMLAFNPPCVNWMKNWLGKPWVVMPWNVL